MIVSTRYTRVNTRWGIAIINIINIIEIVEILIIEIWCNIIYVNATTTYIVRSCKI